MSEADRRPIPARELVLSKRAAAALAQAGVSANAISVAGAVLGVAAGALLANTASLAAAWPWLLAAVCIFSRLLANMFDGMVAIATGTASVVGELYNEVPDRLSDTAILVGAGYAVGSSVEWGYAAAVAAMLTAYVRVLGRSCGAKQEFCGPMAKQHRMAVVIAASAWIAVGLWQPTDGLMRWALIVITVGALATAVRRLLRIARQLRAVVV